MNQTLFYLPHSWLGVPLFRVRGEREVIDALASRLRSSGVSPAVDMAVDAVRVERGRPWFGVDFGDDYLPQETGLEHEAVSFTKGCYLGQETVARLHHLGHVNRQLRGIVVVGDASIETGATLSAAGKEVGVVTSVGYSPRRQSTVALAYVRRQHAEPGTRLELPSGSSSSHAEVTSLPMP